jgi:UDP-N-acetylglucosamine 2-epimerase (non-hydrolysing)/GDP/UDP-N,N'-diacetylbacillosamine 2-epimerase (hydrolysing)
VVPTDPKQRRIAVFSSSRADYGHLYWVLKALQADSGIDLRILVSGAHLSPQFGRSAEAFAADGFAIEARIEALLDADSDVAMAKTIGVALLGLADVLDRLRPDLLLLIADRYEMLAPSAAALALRIPIAHIEGGEISEGAVDDAVRNALTKLAHLHFVPTAQARARVLAMGEEAWRVHQVGAPSLDHLRHSKLPSREALESVLGMAVAPAPLVVAVHPVTLLADPLAEVDALFDALARIDRPIVFCFPNADTGYAGIVERARGLCAERDHACLHVNLPHLHYWALLQQACALIGNSSSGIMETPSLALPCVNVGIRQQGRERAPNIVDVPADIEAILDGLKRALSSEFRTGLKGMRNPYGDGHAGSAIARILADTPLGTALLHKRALPLDPELLAEGRYGFADNAPR